MTYRQRRMARAQHLEAWADKRERKAVQTYQAVDEMLEGLPPGQPILLGHHSEAGARRYHARIDARMRSGVDNEAKAVELRQRASNIKEAAEQAIYNDDPDATERLAEKLAILEARRTAILAYNRSCRRGLPDRTLLTEQQWKDIQHFGTVARAAPGEDGPLPGYVLSNLGGNIRRTGLRLQRLKRAAAKREGRR